MPFEKYGVEQPPDEPYGRVTNPERFRPLHHAVLEMLNALESRFDVERVEGYGLDKELEKASSQPASRPAITLKPIHPESAPITVVFTDFPGLHIRFGRWFTDSFPSCGCDACDESADGEMERATELIDSLTSGGFREAVFHSPRSLPSVIVDKLKGDWAAMKTGYPKRRYLRYASSDAGNMAMDESPAVRGKSMRGSRRVTEFRVPSLRRTNRRPLSDTRALELTGGKPSLELDWKPWPPAPRTLTLENNHDPAKPPHRR